MQRLYMDKWREHNFYIYDNNYILVVFHVINIEPTMAISYYMKNTCNDIPVGLCGDN